MQKGNILIQLIEIKRKLYQNNQMDNKKSFSIEYTTFIKGIAIVLLVIHHYSGIQYCSNVDLFNTNIREIIFNLCKVCVSVFAILSGYGMYKSAIKQTNIIKLSLKRILLVLIGYWMAFIVWLIYTLIYMGSIDVVYKKSIVVSFIKDCFGLCHIGYPTNSLNGVSWFIGAILIFYICFPLLFWTIKKLKNFDWILVLLSAISLILYAFGIELYLYDSIVYYAFAFVLGMFIAKRQLFDFFVNYKLNSPKVILMAMVFVLSCIIRLVVGLVFDTLFAVIVIIVLITIFQKNKIIDKVSIFFGKEELFIYLFHTTVLSFVGIYFGWMNKWISRLVAFAGTIIIAFVFTKVYKNIKNRLSERVFSG